MAASVQVLLVSAQAAPNLLAALDPALKPSEAVLMVTRKMQLRAVALEAVLNEAGVRTKRVVLDDEHDFEQLVSAMLEFAAPHDGADFAMNLTGGTKLMALAAQSVAEAHQWKRFYIDLDTDEVIWLERNMPRQKLTAHLRLSHYLRGYGYRPVQGVTRPTSEQRHNVLLDTLVLQIGSLEHGIARLNYLGQQAEDQRTLTVTIADSQRDDPHLDRVLSLFAQAQALRRVGDRIEFASSADLAFVKGGWLETFVYRTLEALHGKLGLRDKAVNLVVEDSGGVRNEMDIAFMARNRLHVIECKTARMNLAERPKANDALFKLVEICRRVGGLGTKGLLASYRGIGDSERRLAHALNIELICGAELARLPERLTSWINRGTD